MSDNSKSENIKLIFKKAVYDHIYFSYDKFFIYLHIYYNLRVLKKEKGQKWETIPSKWRREHISKFLNFLQKNKIKWQDLNDKIGKRERRSRNSLDTEEKLIEEVQKIYNKEGIVGLIPVNINNKYGNLHDRVISKTKTSKRNPQGYPCIWCCKKLNIMDEYEIYIKSKKTHECNFEELIQYHIDPIIKEVGHVPTLSWIQQNNHSRISTRLIELGKSWEKDITIKHYGQNPKSKFVVNEDDKKIICNSYPEALIYKTLLEYGIKIVDTEIPYNKMFPDWEGKHTCDCLIDYNGELYYIEIWGAENATYATQSVFNKKEYMKNRKLKEERLESDNTHNFIGLEYKIANSTNKIKKEFIKNIKRLTGNTITLSKNEKQITITSPSIEEEKKYCIERAKQIKEEQNIDFLPSVKELRKIDTSLVTKIQRHWGGVDPFRKELGEDLQKRRKIYARKGIETRDKNGTQQKGSSHPNFGKKLSEETKKKISETRIKKGVAKGNNNPNSDYQMKLKGQHRGKGPNSGKKMSDEQKKKYLKLV